MKLFVQIKYLVLQLLLVEAFEGNLACCQLPENDSKAVDIHRLIVRLHQKHLWYGQMHNFLHAIFGSERQYKLYMQ